MPEILDLYTRGGEPTGLTIQRGDAMPAGLLHPVCDVWLVNRHGEVLIQKRSMRKAVWPGRWCCSAGGCVTHGEAPLTAALRETQEEIGLTLDPACGRLLATVPGGKALHQVWLFRQDAPLDTLTMQPEEVDALRYVTAQELARLIRSGTEFVNVVYLKLLLAALEEPAEIEGRRLYAENL